LKKPTGLVQFRFYKPEIEKTKPNWNKKNPRKNPSQTRKKPIQTGKTEPKTKKPSQTGKTEPTGLNRFLSKKPNRTETGRFEPVSVIFFKNKFRFGNYFLIKTKPNWTENDHSYASPSPFQPLLPSTLNRQQRKISCWNI